MRKFFFLLNIFLIFGIFFTFNIQKINAQLSSSDILVDIFPEFPNPNEEIKVSVKSFATDLNKASIIWSVNNQAKSAGIGRTTFSFNAGESSTIINLSVNIETITGQNITREIVITPSSVDLLWEAVDSYSPPFYKGKTLVAKEGQFKVVAIPANRGFESINQNNMLYTWKKDDKNQKTASGWGKNSFTFKNHYLDNFNQIEVSVSDITGNSNANNKISLSGFEPKILFYKKDLTGNVLYNQALKNGFSVKEGGENIVVAPYFFSPSNIKSNDLSFKWFLNGLELLRTDLKNEISVVGDEKGGVSTLKLSINNKKTLFQEAESSIQMEF